MRRDRIEYQFRKRLRVERERRGWSQTEVAKRLEGKGFPFYGSTIAKVEAGDRAVGIAEAVAIAELFEVPLSSLLGRRSRPERDVDYAIGALMDAVYTSRTGIGRIARPLRDRLEDTDSSFPEYGTLAKCSDEVQGHLDMARKALEKFENQLFEIVEQRVRAEVDAELMGGSQE